MENECTSNKVGILIIWFQDIYNLINACNHKLLSLIVPNFINSATQTRTKQNRIHISRSHIQTKQTSTEIRTKKTLISLITRSERGYQERNYLLLIGEEKSLRSSVIPLTVIFTIADASFFLLPLEFSGELEKHLMTDTVYKTSVPKWIGENWDQKMTASWIEATGV